MAPTKGPEFIYERTKMLKYDLFWLYICLSQENRITLFEDVLEFDMTALGMELIV